jgi:hypothetical protein
MKERKKNPLASGTGNCDKEMLAWPGSQSASQLGFPKSETGEGERSPASPIDVPRIQRGFQHGELRESYGAQRAVAVSQVPTDVLTF